MNWEQDRYNFGTIVEKSSIKIVFDSVKELDIESITPGCGSCTTIKGYDPKTKKLTVIYSSDEIPVHLRHNPGYQMVVKGIKITHKSGEVETLIFTGKVIRKK